jgi:hypothetical protein
VPRRGWVVVGILATLVLIAVAWLVPGQTRLVARAYIPSITAIAITARMREILDPSPSAPRPRQRRRRRGPRSKNPLKELSRIEATVSVSPSSAKETYHRLRPILREIAADRLEVGRRIALDDDPVRTRAVLGDEAWALLRPDLPMPEDRSLPGPSLISSEKIVASLEAI